MRILEEGRVCVDEVNFTEMLWSHITLTWRENERSTSVSIKPDGGKLISFDRSTLLDP
jgi:hypothetical protein